MDDKERALIARALGQLRSGNYSELDVLALLIILRRHAKPDEPLLEVANFIAHREKDRGAIHAYLLRTKSVLDNLGMREEVLAIQPVFSLDELMVSTNAILEATDHLGFDSREVQDLMLCIMSLLQGVRIMNGKSDLGTLLLARTSAEIHLLGSVWVQDKVRCVFPVLIVQNAYCEGPDDDTPLPFESLVHARCTAGSLRLLPDGPR